MKTFVGMTVEQARRILALEIVPVSSTGLPLPASTAKLAGADPVQCRVELIFDDFGNCREVVIPSKYGVATLFSVACDDPPEITFTQVMTLLRGEDGITILDCTAWCRLGWIRDAIDREDGDNQSYEHCDESHPDAKWDICWYQHRNHLDYDYPQAFTCPCCDTGYVANPCHRPVEAGSYDDWQMPSLADFFPAKQM